MSALRRLVAAERRNVLRLRRALALATLQLHRNERKLVRANHANKPPELTTGPDVYEGDGRVDWRRVKNHGCTFGICKATEGLTFIDHRLSYNWREIHNAGLIRGAYHFGHPGESAVAQARHFVATVRAAGGWKKGDLCPILDIEVTDGRPSNVISAWVRAFAAEVKRLTGHDTIVYTYTFFLSWPPMTSSLWLANYGHEPLLPTGFSHYSLWQYTSSGLCPGVPGRCDISRANPANQPPRVA